MQAKSTERTQQLCDLAVPYVEVLALLLLCSILVIVLLIIFRQILQ
jgi:hypothetical protein